MARLQLGQLQVGGGVGGVQLQAVVAALFERLRPTACLFTVVGLNYFEEAEVVTGFEFYFTTAEVKFVIKNSKIMWF